MAANEIHINDIGTVFTITVKDGSSVVDISSASTKQVIIKKPGGTKLTKDSAFVTDGTDGQMKYTIVSGDLDETGTYKLQGYLIISDGTFYTDITSFKVYRNL
jgi:hypothetical protein